MRIPLHLVVALPTLLLALPTHTFSCQHTAAGVTYDFSRLSGLRSVNKHSPTPPTTSEAQVQMDLCGPSGVPRENDIADEDQCPENTKLCVKLLNHKSSSSDPDRVTAVVPLWPVDLSDDNVWTRPMGKDGSGELGLRIWVEGREYAGGHQHLNLTLRCDPHANEVNPTLVAYINGRLTMEWASPDACPRSRSPSGTGSGGGGSDGSGSGQTSRGIGFWGFIKFLFYGALIGLVAYFALGMFYNHQQYSAKGWDLVPHRDFWREFPTLISDLFGHVYANVRSSGGGGGGSSSRGGYSSLG